MRTRVMKFGGTSLLTPRQRQLATTYVREAIDEGFAPVVVVSAFGRRGDPYATDTLMDLARSAYADVPAREMALLAGCGEIVATVVMTNTLRCAGIEAVALTGSQAGIRTSSSYAGAVILSLEVGGLFDSLRQHRVPVVTGFQGETPEGEVSILDRGGSDISSTALGYALRAERVDIFTDVPGVMTADPRHVPDARLIEEISFEEALSYARCGAKVIHPEALQWAMRLPTEVYIRSMLHAGQHTRIVHDAVRDAATRSCVGVACRVLEDRGSTEVSVVGVPAAAEGSALLELARTALVSADVQVLSLRAQPQLVRATVPQGDTAAAARALHTLFVAGSINLVGVNVPPAAAAVEWGTSPAAPDAADTRVLT